MGAQNYAYWKNHNVGKFDITLRIQETFSCLNRGKILILIQKSVGNYRINSVEIVNALKVN